MRRARWLLLVGGLTVWLSACNSSDEALPNALEVIAQDTRMSAFYSLLSPDITSLLEDESLEFTLFVPDNDAWSEAMFAQLNVSRPTGQALENVLYFHLVPGKRSLKNIRDEAAEYDYAILETALNDYFFAYSLDDGEFVLDPGLLVDDPRFADSKFFDITFVASDIAASNGTIHLIDKVLLTPTVSESVFLAFISDEEQVAAEYYQALDNAGVFDELLADGPFTTFVPEYSGVLEQLSESQLAYLLNPANIDILVRVINNHIIEGVQLLGRDVDSTLTVSTRAGQTYRFELLYDEEGDFEYWTLGGLEVYYDADDEDVLFSEVWRNGTTFFLHGMLLPEDVAAVLEGQ